MQIFFIKIGAKFFLSDSDEHFFAQVSDDSKNFFSAKCDRIDHLWAINPLTS